MDEIPENRCGYTIFDAELPNRLDGVCCYLPTWKDEDRCIWHSESKTGADVEEACNDCPEYLYGAVLCGISVSELDFSDCKLSKSDLSNSSFQECDFSNASLWNADIKGSNLVRNRLRRADLSDSDLSNSNFSHTNLDYTNFNHATVSQTNFSQASIQNSEFLYVDAYASDFSGADLSGAVFSGAYIAFADLSNIFCLGGEFNEATLDATDLRNSQISDSNFMQSKLTGANLTEANAQNCSFKSSNLEDATFVRTELRDANLRDTKLYQTLFSDTRINSNTDFGEKSAYEDPDTELGENYDDTSNWEAAAWVYRRLQDLHEENAMSEEAREYHVRKEEAQRREYWENGEWFKWAVHTGNYHLTRHGENLWQVVKWSGGTIGGCTLLYPVVGGIANAEGTHSIWSLSDPSLWDGLLLFLRSLYFSTVTFTTLGYGDYHPVGPWAKALAGAESLAGALLVALFVFVLGRRVAR